MRFDPLRRMAVAALGLAITLAPAPEAQAPGRPPTADQSAAHLAWLVRGLTVTPRVLLIGMHPDDEDTRLITWLSRARHVETGYLSITRGESGGDYGGSASGATLGAIRTQEALAARRIDGAKIFFTRAHDFGVARRAADVRWHWMTDSVVGDIVAVIRSFRPHVVVAMLPLPDSAVVEGDGQHQALEDYLVRALAAAEDSARFRRFGAPWRVSKVYRPGHGLRIETAGYDPGLGKTYAELAVESRGQQRSQGLRNLMDATPAPIALRRVFLHPNGAGAPPIEESLFEDVDTSFARLARGASPEVAALVPAIAAYADSAARALDAMHPDSAVPYLAELARLASSARAAAPWCRHPSASAAPPVIARGPCDLPGMDLDASIDLVRERGTAALFAAAGLSFTARADRELVADDDTARVTITLGNHGTRPATLADVAVTGSLEDSVMTPAWVPPDSSVAVHWRVTGLRDPSPWWAGPRGGGGRGGDRYDGSLSAVDGVPRGGVIVGGAVLGVAVPENIRRPSDVRVTVGVAGVTVSASIGPVLYRQADAAVGVQYRPLAGIPDVTLQFTRGLEWIRRGRPVNRSMRVAVKSHSDHAQTFGLEIVTVDSLPRGIRVDSLPRSLRLEPHEERELFVRLRGRMLDTARIAIGLLGRRQAPVDSAAATSGRATAKAAPVQAGRLAADTAYDRGFLTVQRDYLPPIRLLPTSGEWIQPIDITVPATLSTLYVSGNDETLAASLRQVDAWVTQVSSADELLSVDLSKVKTVLIGAHAFDVHPELLGQVGRLLDFMRTGGTLVLLRGGASTMTSGLFPYPVELGAAGGEGEGEGEGERALEPYGPVGLLNPTNRLLRWPNRIGAQDWDDWVASRAEQMPTRADRRYTTLIAVGDEGRPPNPNAILEARVGKGRLIYTALTLEQQIAGGVPGAMRLLVNLLSAGMPMRSP